MAITSTPTIIAARYLTATDPVELAGHCMQDIDAGFVERVQPATSWWRGPTSAAALREHAPIAIKAAGISAVIADLRAHLLSQRAQHRLPIIETRAAARINADDEVTVDTEGHDRRSHHRQRFEFAPLTDVCRPLPPAAYMVKERLGRTGPASCRPWHGHLPMRRRTIDCTNERRADSRRGERSGRPVDCTMPMPIVTIVGRTK